MHRYEKKVKNFVDYRFCISCRRDYFLFRCEAGNRVGRKNRIAWSEKMQAEGPWKEKAIWKSPDNDFYLICNQYNETDGITVSAYVQVESEWIKCYPGCITGPKRLFFDTNDGTYSNDFFDCAAVLENDRLILSDIACDNGYFKNVDKIVLVKCDYADVFDSLPFETVN